jgi:hypothetical protein
MDEISDYHSSETAVDALDAVPSWYRVPEIPTELLAELLKSMYDILEGKKRSKSEADPFANDTWRDYHNMTNDEFEHERKQIQTHRAWTMLYGEFHQTLLGSFPGWTSYGKGHSSGCDIGTLDGTCIGEVKNNTNTMNSSSKDSVLRKLKIQNALGKRTLLIIVNGDTKHNTQDGIEWISGREFYAEISGRSEFMDDLHWTLRECFKQFKSHTSLKMALGIK